MVNFKNTPHLAWLGLSVLVLVAEAVLFAAVWAGFSEENRWTIHTHDVMEKVENILSLMQDAETGQRGYLLTGKYEYLGPYNKATQAIHARLSELRGLTSDNPRQQVRIANLQRLIAQKLDELEYTIELRRTRGIEAAVAVVLTERGREIMDRIRTVVQDMDSEELALLDGRSARTRARAKLMILVMGSGGGLLLLVLLAGARSIHRNIRTRARAEAAERAQREWLQVTLESIGDGVIATDSNGVVTLINPVAAELTGWSREAAIAQAVETVFPIRNELTGETVENPVRRVIREGRIAGLGNHTVLISRDGKRIPLDDSGAPIVDPSGNVVGAILIFRDASEKKAREAELLRRDRMLRFSLDAIIIMSAQRRIQYWNRGAFELYGWEEADVRDKVAEELLHTAPPASEIDEILSREGQWCGELVQTRKDGETITIESRQVLLYDAEGRVDGILEINRDVTERKRSEERLREAQKLESIGLLAGGIAHDFNNLLVAVIGNASLAQEMVRPGSPVDGLLGNIVKTGEQLAHLTRQLLAYSGKGRFVLEHLNLSDLIAEATSLVQPSIPKRIELRLELEPNLPPIRADRGQIQQVYTNLALNAAEAIGSAPGAITVKTGIRDVDAHEVASISPGTYVCLEVRDTGCGMDEATKARIFDPFFSTKFAGRGLGLSAVSGIVRGHQGAITIASEPNKGSSFTVLLPMSEGAVSILPTPARSTELAGEGTILVVDDESVVREMAAAALKRFGYDVLLADSGPVAIDIFKRHPGDIALVLLDLSMPGMGGEEILPELRKIRPSVKFLVASGYSEAETMRLFAGQRVSSFLQKPFTAIQLAEQVKSALA